MISVYIDWSVIAQMKNGLHGELNDALQQKDRFFIPYSTSHIGDIFSSYSEDPQQQQRIDADLEYLSHLTSNRCFANETDQVRLQIVHPKELFAERVEDKDLLKDFSIDSLTSHFEDDELGGLMKAQMDRFKQLPLDKGLIDGINDPVYGEQLEKLFPGLKDDPTWGGFFKAFGKMLQNMNEGDGYKALRQVLQSGFNLNRNKMFNENEPYKVIDELYAKLDKTPFEVDDKYAPKWFNIISNDYIKLDMHGYQEDVVRVDKGRKQTFRNTTEDGFHLAFASMCQFFIINDKRAYEKSKQVVENLKLNLLVFKPNEFMDFYKNYLTPRSRIEEIQLPRIYLTSPHVEYEIKGAEVWRSFVVYHFMFDFFNRMHLMYNSDENASMVMMGRIMPTNKPMTWHFEITNLSKKLYAVLGMDIDGKGDITEAELRDSQWEGRRWALDGNHFRFIRCNGYYQFYYDFEDGGEYSLLQRVTQKIATWLRRQKRKILEAIKSRTSMNQLT